MDGQRIGALARWLNAGRSRRGLLDALGGAGLALVGGPRAGTAGPNRHHTRRCKKPGVPCRPDGRPCCRSHTCGGPPEARFCCKQGGQPCGGNGECCNLTCVERACFLN